jgi:hypothetical protein
MPLKKNNGREPGLLLVVATRTLRPATAIILTSMTIFNSYGEPDQLAFISGEGEELGSFCGGQKLAAGHRSKAFVRAGKKRL